MLLNCCFLSDITSSSSYDVRSSTPATSSYLHANRSYIYQRFSSTAFSGAIASTSYRNMRSATLVTSSSFDGHSCFNNPGTHTVRPVISTVLLFPKDLIEFLKGKATMDPEEGKINSSNQNKEYNLLSEISPAKKRWCVRTRVTRMRKFTNDDPLINVGLVLLDEQGTSMLAQISKQDAPHFESLLVEGQIYCLSNFNILPYKSAYRVVQSENVIFFTSWTKVERSLENPPTFPLHVYQLTPLSMIQERIGSLEAFTGMVCCKTFINCQIVYLPLLVSY